MKKRWYTLIAALLILGLLAGCGSGAAGSAEQSGAADTAEASESEEAQDVESVQAEPVPEESTSEESAVDASEENTAPEEPAEPEITGAVIPAEDCAAEGYDVRYGMYDYETYAPLPLTEDGDSFTYWCKIQPFMMAYSIDTTDATFFREMEARTGVHLDVLAISEFMAADNFSLMVTAGDYTDLIKGGVTYYSGGAGKAIDDGVILDLVPYLEEYMPNYSAWMDFDPFLRASVLTLDGGIAVAANYTGDEWNVGPQIRADWLEALSLSSPVTYDDYHDVITAFKQAYGATLWLPNSGSPRSNVLSSGYDVRVNDDFSDFRVIDGIVEYCPTTEDYHEFIALLHDWYAEGLIYPDFMTQSNQMDSGLITNNEIGIWFSDVSNFAGFQTLSDEIQVGAAALPRRTAGQQLHIYLPSSTSLDGTSISTACNDPELLCQWLDYIYTYDGTLLVNYGVEGEGMTFDGDGAPMYTDLVLNNPDMITVAAASYYSKFAGAGVIDAYRFADSYSDSQKAAIELWTAGLDNDYTYPTSINMTLEESERASELLSSVETYVDQYSLAFITGSIDPSSDWDSFQSGLSSLEVEELVEIYQTAYDRYAAAVS